MTGRFDHLKWQAAAEQSGYQHKEAYCGEAPDMKVWGYDVAQEQAA